MTKKRILMYLSFFIIWLLYIWDITNIFAWYNHFKNIMNSSSSWSIFQDVKLTNNVKKVFNIDNNSFEIYFWNESNIHLHWVNKIFLEKEVYGYKDVKDYWYDSVITHEVIHYKLSKLSFYKKYTLIKKLRENKLYIDKILEKEIDKMNNWNESLFLNDKFFMNLYYTDQNLNKYSINNDKWEFKKIDDIDLIDGMVDYKKNLLKWYRENIGLMTLSSNYYSLDEYITYFFENYFDKKDKQFYIPKDYFDISKNNDELNKILQNYEYFKNILNDTM